MAKAEVAVNDSQLAMTAIVRDGLIRACGSLKAAAITMGIDQGQLTRDLASGKFNFERLDRLSPSEKAIVVACLYEEFRALTTPLARLREIYRLQQQLQDEAMQIAEALAS